MAMAKIVHTCFPRWREIIDAAEAFGGFPEESVTAAGTWNHCAVGEMLCHDPDNVENYPEMPDEMLRDINIILPEAIIGISQEGAERLRSLGIDFDGAIAEDDFNWARDILDEMEEVVNGYPWKNFVTGETLHLEGA